MTVNNTLAVSVQYPPETQKVNFEISLQMKPADDKNLTVTLQLELLDRIAKLYGDANTSYIVVRSASCNPFVLTWTNSSLASDTCDNTTILNLLNVSTDYRLYWLSIIWIFTLTKYSIESSGMLIKKVISFILLINHVEWQ